MSGVNPNKVFIRAVKGNLARKKKEEEKNAPKPVPMQMMPYPYPVGFEPRPPEAPKLKPEGISLNEVSTKYVMPRQNEDEVDTKGINLTYALIPRDSKNPFASVNIRWVAAESSLVYFVNEPKLTPEENDVLLKIKTALIEKLDVDFTTLRKGEAKNYLKDKFREMVLLIAKDMSREKQEQILYYIERDFIGMEKIEPMLQDSDIEDISCDGVGIPIYIYHRNPFIGSIRSNVAFSTAEELDKFVNKLAQRCGKTVSVATPLVGGSLPDGSRIQATLGTDIARRGSNFTIRKFTEEPLTPVHMIKFKTADAKLMAYLWLMIEYGKSTLISGGTASGKTSLLNALSLLIKSEMKIVSIEDSVTGDCNIIANRNGKFEKTTIGNLIDSCIAKYGKDVINGREWCSVNPELISVFTMTKDGKMMLAPVQSFIRHKVKKDILEIATRTGRKIKVTGDHSLFGLDAYGNISPIEARKLSHGSFIAVPRYLPFSSGGIHCINLEKCLDKLENLFVNGKEIKNIERKSLLESGMNNNRIGYLKTSGTIPTKTLDKLIKNKYNLDTSGLSIRPRSGGKRIPLQIEIDNDFLAFIGLWLAEGSYDKNTTIISSWEKECRIPVINFTHKLNLSVKEHSDKVSLMIHSSALKKVMQNVLELTGNAYTKKIPHWMLNFNDEQIGIILKGYFSGDGHVSKNEIEISSSSKELLKDVQMLLLRYGIIGRIGKFKERDKTYTLRISSTVMLKKFRENIGFLQDYKKINLDKLCSKISTHDTTDIIPLSSDMIKLLDKSIGGFNTNCYYNNSNVGRNKLLEYSNRIETELMSRLAILANSDIFWDEINEIKNLGVIEDFVYDLSVPEFENFVCENIIAHNTPELRLPHPHWIPQVARQPIAEISGRAVGEVDLFDLLRESLRQRPDFLIVGEVRGKEAFVLFQQIATGHPSLATIHADTVDRLIDRITTPPISLPPSLIEALDLIIFITKIRYGNSYVRKITDIFEVTGFDRDKNIPILNEVFKWEPKTDKFIAVNSSVTLKKISDQFGIDPSNLQREINQRTKVLQWMTDKDLTNYKDVARIIKLYNTKPEELLASI